MAIGVNWAEIWAPVWKAVWTDVPPIEIPDVVGETQAAGTTGLETALFVVAVETAYSPSVAVGLIISQDPIGGSFANEGSTVTITVSLGPEPVQEQTGAIPGGWFFLGSYEADLQRRRARERERKQVEEETDQIEDDLDRNIAQLMREQEAIDDKRADLERLGKLARQDADIEAARRYSEKVAKAYAKAIKKGTAEALVALDQELQRAQEEESFLLMTLMLLDD